MKIVALWKKLRFHWRRAFANDEQWIAYLRSLGMEIGQECRIIDRTIPAEPFLISIGDHVTITEGVRFLTHDGAIWLARKEMPAINRFGPIRIGNNCFVGTNAILLPGVVVGDDCVIAAGSVVAKDVPSGSIVGGVPARKIAESADYIAKAKRESLPVSPEEEARILSGENQTSVMKPRLIEMFRKDPR